MKSKMKKRCVKILTAIICVITLVTVLVVPTFAYSDLGEMTPSATTCDRNASIGSVIQLRAKGAWNKRDTYPDLPDFDYNYMLFRTDSDKYMYLKIDIFDSVGDKDLTTTLQFQVITFDWYYIDDVVGVKIYLDFELVLDIARAMSDVATLGVHYYGIDGSSSYIDWTNSGYFDMYFYTNYAWLVYMNGFGDINPFYSFFDYIAVTAPSAYNSGFSVGYEEGEADGYTNGYAEGYDIGSEDSYWDGWDDGFDDGSDVGYEVGLNNGYDAGFEEGYSGGYDVGYAEGDLSGREIGLVNGYFNGYADAEEVHKNDWANGFGAGQNDMAETTKSFKEMVFAIFDAPVTLIDGMLGFEIFGINMAGLVKTIITLAVVALIVFVILKFAKG